MGKKHERLIVALMHQADAALANANIGVSWCPISNHPSQSNQTSAPMKRLNFSRILFQVLNLSK